MAIRNNFAVYINGINLTPFCVNPIKWGNFLDEQLDEMYLSLRHGPFENIKPLSPVEIHFTNELYFGSTTVDIQTKIKRYLVANDNAEESPVGSKCYNHDLYLIEVTKFAECVVVDTLTFTNDLGRNYTENAVKNLPVVDNDTYGVPVTPNSYINPLLKGSNFETVSSYTIYPYGDFSGASVINDYIQEIYEPNNETAIFSNTYQIRYSSTGEKSTQGQNIGYTIVNLVPGTYKIVYIWSQRSGTLSAVETATYYFDVCENQYPLKKWTITDVINRLLNLAEPLRQGERPRFILQGIDPDTGDIQPNTQAARFDKILAPQFSFTKQTLRECLKEIGGVVHGEPRLDIAQDSDGNYYYEVSFDLYGQTGRAGIYAKPYIQKTVSQVIDSYASCLDSNAENLVNQLDKLAGVIVEPYAGGYKTVRTETMYARITDANMLIQTQYPIYTIEKLECGFIPDYPDEGQNIDITPYVFESSIYNTRLSSYDSQYPLSKAFGITYTQGQKNLTALNFKQEHPINDVFNRYAIINILRAATGNNSIDISLGSDNENNYPLLAFRVTYTPFYNSRVGQTKVNYQDYPRAAALIYNQQANVIESRYYGENLKGVIARLGNLDKSITYNLARLSDIPKAGQMYNDDYYISTVAVEYLPTYIKCTIGLSKNFNRLSQYIGISSVKRYSEVSQGQAVERNTLWKEYIVIGDEEEEDEDCFISQLFVFMVLCAFTQDASAKISSVDAWGTSYSNDELPSVRLPVISSAFGNSIAFSWTYEDNYSAGAISQYAESDDVTGYFQNNYQYTDYYGRMYYYNFTMYTGYSISTPEQQKEIGTSLPGIDEHETSGPVLSTIGKNPIILRKDNREAMQCNFQVDLVSNRKGLIIGSALASYCTLIRDMDSSLAAKLYIFNEPLDKFIYHVEGSLGVELDDLTAYDITVNTVDTSDGTFSVTAANFPVSGKAWAIVTGQTGETTTVEDEEGNITTQTIQKGGDVLIAQNMDISAGDAFPTVYFTKKREVFDKSVWITNR